MSATATSAKTDPETNAPLPEMREGSDFYTDSSVQKSRLRKNSVKASRSALPAGAEVAARHFGVQCRELGLPLRRREPENALRFILRKGQTGLSAAVEQVAVRQMRHAPQQYTERRLAARGLQQGLQRRKAIHGLLTRAGAAVAPPDLRAMRSDRRSQRCGIGCGKRKYGLLRAAQMPAHRRQQQRERIQRALVRVHAAGRLQHLCLCLPSCILQLRRCSAVQPEADHPGKTTAGASLRCGA